MNAHHCALCGETIDQYDPALHRLRIKDDAFVDICPPCIDAFTAWQSKVLARLFPTKAMKKITKSQNPTAQDSNKRRSHETY
ncbi:MAG: hypothetical protein ABIH41_00295 [Nanoarchaeota archaeon]